MKGSFVAEQRAPNRICPLLGLAEDREARFTYPEAAHLCYAAERPDTIPLDHQAAFCLTSNYPACSRYVEPPEERAGYIPPPPLA
ncbi:MAG: hypothetical protein D6796_14485, partial [Caldilineae bacterium]